MERSSSENSSVRVVPPASRAGFETPTERQLSTNETPIPESPKQHFEEMAAKAPQAEPLNSTSPSSKQTRPISNESIIHQEAAVPDEYQSSGFPSSTREVPGAFPGDDTPEPSIYQSTPYSSKLDPRVDSTPRSQMATTAPGTTPNRNDDPFAMAGNGSHSTAPVNDDFDSAFAALDKGKAPENTNGTVPEAPKAHGEFPPIQEMGADDESDSDEDRGFDDDFTRHSANCTTESGPNQVLQTRPAGLENQLAPSRPLFSTMESNTSLLPTPGAQASPPTYDQTVGSPIEGPGHRKESNQFPAEYSGLLPSRDDPTSPSGSLPPASSSLPSNVGAAAGIDRGLNFFGNDTPEHAAGHAAAGSAFTQEHSPMSPGASTSAPYAYTQSSPPITQQSHTYAPTVPTKAPIHDDFDDEFADLTDAKEESEHGDSEFISSRQQDFDEFNPTFDSPAVSRHTAQSSNTFSPNASTTEAPSHDWDAIFAGLDHDNGVQAGPGPRDFATSLGPAPVQQASQATKPALARAVTEDDDPILKRLTGMGYPREESLQALEKFDYNLDKVGSLC